MTTGVTLSRGHPLNLVGLTVLFKSTFMNFISDNKINKRGKLYRTRSTKTANGWSKHLGSMNFNHKMGRLSVVGTFDSLGRVMRFDIIKVKLKHPTEFGYTKESYILKKNKSKFLDRIV